MMKTLYVRIIVTTMIIMIASSVIAFIGTNIYYHVHLKPENDEKITDMAHRVKDIIADSSGDETKDLSDLSNLGYQFLLVGPDGDNHIFGNDFRVHNLKAESIDQVINGQEYHGIKHYPYRLFITGFFSNKSQNTVGIPITIDGQQQALFVRPDTQLQFGEMRIFLAVLLVFILLLSFLFVLISTTYIVHPVKKLTAATHKIAGGNYHVKLDNRRRDEIGRLARDFSKMSDSLEQTESRRQAFVSNVSHEIQSPLTSIKGFSRAIREEDMTDEERNHYLGIIETESERLSNLSKQLLTLSFLDQDATYEDWEQFDLAAQLKEVVSVTQWQWQDKELTVEMDVGPIQVTGDPKLLQQVWMNLLTNAIRYTEAGGTIKLRTQEDRTMAYVTVEDTGVGMNEEALNHVFERFYKVDEARTRTENSTGLGLSIVKKIIEVHNGTITVTSEPGKGSAFHVSLVK